jgi:outer membrane protein OmpA-like peptidoglycan-associated protein
MLMKSRAAPCSHGANLLRLTLRDARGFVAPKPFQGGNNGDMTTIIQTSTMHASPRLSLARHRLALLSLGLVLVAGMSLMTPARADDNLPVDAVPLNVPLGPIRNTIQHDDEPPLASAPQAAPGATATESAAEDITKAPARAILRILFEDNDATLSDDARAAITRFAETFKVKGGRVALMGYAGKAGSTSSNARRLSLRRVLTVREQLLAHGISADRLEVRALGGVKDAGPEGRVDIVKSSR